MQHPLGSASGIRQQLAIVFGILVIVALSGAPHGASATTARRALRPPVLGAPLYVGAASPLAVRDPRRNISPDPDFVETCATRGGDSKACIRKARAAIENARARDGARRTKLVLPRNYRRLSVAEQTFVITNLERVNRGLPPFRGLTEALNNVSHLAAVLHIDPAPVMSLLQLLGIEEYGSIWAGDFGALASDYDWMYNDGYALAGSVNIDCVAPRAEGCWGHRHNILGSYNHLPLLLAGAGAAKPQGLSIAEVLSGGRGRAPKFTYTWKRAVAHGANAHRHRHRHR